MRVSSKRNRRAPTGICGGHQHRDLGFRWGGVDTLTALSVLRVPSGFRVEVRDFYSGSPKYNQAVSGSLQHNVVFTGGLLLSSEGVLRDATGPMLLVRLVSKTAIHG